MVGARPDSSSHAPLPLPARPLGGGNGVGGRAGAHLGPSSQGSLARSGTRAQTGGRGEEMRPGPVLAGLAPLSLSLWARADSLAHRPRGPGRRCARSTPGRWEERRWRKDARAVTRQGRGNCGASAILSPSPYLRPRGRAHHPPSRRGGGRAPSWLPPSRPLNSPGARGYCHRLASTASSHGTRDAGGGWEKWKTLLSASRRRRFRGPTKMAAAVSAATTTTSTTTTAHYRYRRRGPSSRERQ